MSVRDKVHRTGNPDIVHIGSPATCPCNGVSLAVPEEIPQGDYEEIFALIENLPSSQFIDFLEKLAERFGV